MDAVNAKVSVRTRMVNRLEVKVQKLLFHEGIKVQKTYDKTDNAGKYFPPAWLEGGHELMGIRQYEDGKRCKRHDNAACQNIERTHVLKKRGLFELLKRE